MKYPIVSIIITTKNEATHIAPCLESIRKQTYKNTEMIVVDNYSRDMTKQIAKRYTKYIFDGGPERSAQRNYGAKQAKGEYLLFLDADMVLTPDVIRECVAVCKLGQKAVVIPEKSYGTGFWAKCKALEREQYEGVDWMEAARFFQTDIFNKLSGYNEQLTGPEDFELPQRLKAVYGTHVVGRIAKYILHDEGNLSLAKLIRKKYYYGRKMRRYRNLPESRNYFSRQANPMARYALFFRKPMRLMRDPLHAVGMIWMKTLEMIALALGSFHMQEDI